MTDLEQQLRSMIREIVREEIKTAIDEAKGDEYLSTSKAAELADVAAPEPPARGGFVYFLQCVENGAIKIGYARDVARRLSALRISSPFELKLVAVEWHARPARAERKLHERYSGARIRGEWFRLCHPLAMHIKRANTPHAERTIMFKRKNEAWAMDRRHGMRGPGGKESAT